MVLLTGGQNTVDELLLGDSTILIPINAAENIQDPRLEVTYPLHVPLAPDVEVKVSKLFQLQTDKK